MSFSFGNIAGLTMPLTGKKPKSKNKNKSKKKKKNNNNNKNKQGQKRDGAIVSISNKKTTVDDVLESIASSSAPSSLSAVKRGRRLVMPEDEAMKIEWEKDVAPLLAAAYRERRKEEVAQLMDENVAVPLAWLGLKAGKDYWPVSAGASVPPKVEQQRALIVQDLRDRLAKLCDKRGNVDLTNQQAFEEYQFSCMFHSQGTNGDPLIPHEYSEQAQDTLAAEMVRDGATQESAEAIVADFHKAARKAYHTLSRQYGSLSSSQRSSATLMHVRVVEWTPPDPSTSPSKEKKKMKKKDEEHEPEENEFAKYPFLTAGFGGGDNDDEEDEAEDDSDNDDEDIKQEDREDEEEDELSYEPAFNGDEAPSTRKHSKKAKAPAVPCVVVKGKGPHAAQRINVTHYQKLALLYALARRRRPNSLGGRSAVSVLDKKEFENDLLSLLMRYSTLQGTYTQGAGFQAAISEDVFKVLLRRFDVRMECFASPLNCRYPTFCSAFADTDSRFGSLGSFFDFAPRQGSYEANPPFMPELIRAMTQHMERLLRATKLPLSFVVIIPAWQQTAGWQMLKQSRFMRYHLLLKQRDHGYTEGAQHIRPTRYRISTCNTSVFWLQNKAGATKWRVTKQACDELRDAFVVNYRNDDSTEKKPNGVGGKRKHPAASPFSKRHDGSEKKKKRQRRPPKQQSQQQRKQQQQEPLSFSERWKQRNQRH